MKHYIYGVYVLLFAFRIEFFMWCFIHYTTLHFSLFKNHWQNLLSRIQNVSVLCIVCYYQRENNYLTCGAASSRSSGYIPKK